MGAWGRLGKLAPAVLLLASCGPERPLAAARPQVLVFSKTAGFRHGASITAGIAMIHELGAENGFDVVATEDPNAFDDAGLEPYSAAVFLCTTGDVLAEAQQAAFERFVGAGGGWIGIHSAADTEYDWPFYGSLLGAYFQNHPPGTHSAAIDVEDPDHPSTQALPARWMRTDEWYNFRRNPMPDVRVLLRLDEQTYTGGTMGSDHPISWCHENGGVRAWYTALGHTEQSYAEPLFRAHVAGGISWAGRLDTPQAAAPRAWLLLLPLAFLGLRGPACWIGNFQVTRPVRESASRHRVRRADSSADRPQPQE